MEASVSGKDATFTFSDNVGISEYGVNQSNTEDPSYTATADTSVTWTASSAGTYYVWVKDKAGNKSNAAFTIVSTAFCAYDIGKVWTYGYTGGVQSFTVPCSGTYQLEVWGAQGGTNSSGNGIGGYGGYATGNFKMQAQDTKYIVVGGGGSWSSMDDENSAYVSGGYNGGGAGSAGEGSGGGGATHIASSNYGELKNYSNRKSDVLIVAGGGGGGAYNHLYTDTPNGGTGGGTNGGTGIGGSNYTGVGTGGGSSSGGSGAASGSFGQGGSVYHRVAGDGGGGGWYGGGAGANYNGARAGGGGSGHIAEGVTNSSMKNGVRSGSGYAKITLVSTN